MKESTVVHFSFTVTTKKPSNVRTRPKIEKRKIKNKPETKPKQRYLWKRKDYSDFPRACFGTQLPLNFLSNRKVAKPQGRRGRRESYTVNLFWP